MPATPKAHANSTDSKKPPNISRILNPHTGLLSFALAAKIAGITRPGVDFGDAGRASSDPAHFDKRSKSLATNPC